MSLVDQYVYAAPTEPLRDWLRLQTATFSTMVGGPGAGTSRIMAAGKEQGLLPAGTDYPAVGFHLMPGSVFDNTLHNARFQFDCYGRLGQEAEQLAAALATFLASTPPLTRLAAGLVFQGPGLIVDMFPLPVNTPRIARVVLIAGLTFAAI